MPAPETATLALPVETPLHGHRIPLGDLPAGATGTVVELQGSQELRCRLMEIGLLPGILVRVIRRAPLGCPVEVDVAGSRFSLRATTARCVLVTSDG